MKCPRSDCDFTNPPEAIYCDCGYYFRENDKEATLDAQEKKHKDAQRKPTLEKAIRCRMCGSGQLTANKQGYGWKKGVGVGVCTVGLGLFAGFINSNKVWITCLQCGHRWKPGEDYGYRAPQNRLSGSEALAAYEKQKEEKRIEKIKSQKRR